MENLISVIVPVYNVEKYLNRCVDSIINQTYSNLEIILVDDGSKDLSPKICDELAKKDNRIKVIHKENGGVSQARNCGISVANGDFIAFVDSDDWLELDMYEKLIQKQEENNYDVVLCGFNLAYDNEKFNVEEKSLNNFCKTKDITYLLRHENLKLERNSYSTTNNINCYSIRILYKKEVLKTLRFKENLNYMEDVRFLVELFLNKNIAVGCINDCLYNYYIRQSSLSHGKINNLEERVIKFVESITPILENTEYKNLIKAEKFYAYYMCVANQIKSNSNDNLEMITKWNTKENYKEHKKLCNGFMSKVKAFLIHYKTPILFKLWAKIKKK